MANKIFAERLNQELDNLGLPHLESERIEAFARMSKFPRFKAESILHGEMIPNLEELTMIAKELEVSVEWLLGKQTNSPN
jgi:hypothetical protein